MPRALGVVSFACVAVVAAGACSLFPPDDCASHLRCGVEDAAPGQSADAEAGLSDQTVGEAAAARDAVADAGPDANGDVYANVDAGDAADSSADAFACDPTQSPHDQPCVLDDAYGVFVSTSGRSGAAGTAADPLPTIGDGIARAVQTGKAHVYVCNGTYPEAVTVSSPISLYGALACTAGWSYIDGGAAHVFAGPGQIALTVANVTAPISVEDLRLTAPDAAGTDDAGVARSSIAALVDDSQVTFRRCTFTAGNGANAVSGQAGSNYDAPVAPNGMSNGDGGAGGTGGGVQCHDGTNAQGGAGGSATAVTATDGGNGVAVPMPAIESALALDGLGGTGGLHCTGGDNGASGSAGDGGVASAALGSLAPTGWTPAAGNPGQAGSPGQGGGGGGGKASVTLALGGTGGGAGGCGGAGGGGGGGGGASIALAAIGGSVTLQDCSLTAANGGSGGRGADGQPGQAAGVPAAPAGFLGCIGGVGGNGGGGAGGAGGNGGLSVCILFRGNPPVGSPTCVLGDAGARGPGGNGGDGGVNGASTSASAGSRGGDGLPGVAQPSLQVP